MKKELSAKVDGLATGVGCHLLTIFMLRSQCAPPQDKGAAYSRNSVQQNMAVCIKRFIALDNC